MALENTTWELDVPPRLKGNRLSELALRMRADFEGIMKDKDPVAFVNPRNPPYLVLRFSLQSKNGEIERQCLEKLQELLHGSGMDLAEPIADGAETASDLHRYPFPVGMDVLTAQTHVQHINTTFSEVLQRDAFTDDGDRMLHVAPHSMQDLAMIAMSSIRTSGNFDAVTDEIERLNSLLFELHAFLHAEGYASKALIVPESLTAASLFALWPEHSAFQAPAVTTAGTQPTFLHLVRPPEVADFAADAEPSPTPVPPKQLPYTGPETIPFPKLDDPSAA